MTNINKYILFILCFALSSCVFMTSYGRDFKRAKNEYLIGNYNISDFFSYEFIRVNKNTILEYKKENFLALTIIFFTFCIVWVLLLGIAMPLLIFSGFVFGKWWGILIVLISTSIGALLLYMLASLFFRKIICLFC